MLNECVDAWKTKLEDLPEFKQFLGPEYVLGDVRVNAPVKIFVSPEHLPALVLNFTDCHMEPDGGQWKYYMGGDLLVCAFSGETLLPTRKLNDLTFGDDGVIKKFHSTPSAMVDGIPIKNRKNFKTFQRSFNEDSERNFYICRVIPCSFEIWK